MSNVLVLYSRFSSYVNSAFIHYANKYDSNVFIVRYNLDKNSPFNLKQDPKLSLYNRDEQSFESLKKLIQENNIKTIVCSGWGDKLYRNVCKWAKQNNVLTIMAFDNQWMGTLKQKLLTRLSPLMIKPAFTKTWIPGVFQFEYARRLGFERHNIMLRFYTADTNIFKTKSVINVPKRFLYVGRLLEIKGVHVLLEAVKKLIPDLEANQWEFLIVGNGDVASEFKAISEKHPCIKYHSFLQPEELAQKTADGSVFVLPSNYDAWAVVVHENALMGCPMLLSEAVGSRSAFLMEEFNGKMFATGSSDDLVQKAKEFISLSQETLNKMGERSTLLAAGYNLDIWTDTLYSAIKEYQSGVKHKSLKRTKYQ